MTSGIFGSDDELLEATALAIRRQADACLDGGSPDGFFDYGSAPTWWAYPMLAFAGLIESERQNLNLRTRPFIVAACRQFWDDFMANHNHGAA